MKFVASNIIVIVINIKLLIALESTNNQHTAVNYLKTCKKKKKLFRTIFIMYRNRLFVKYMCIWVNVVTSVPTITGPTGVSEKKKTITRIFIDKQSIFFFFINTLVNVVDVMSSSASLLDCKHFDFYQKTVSTIFVRTPRYFEYTTKLIHFPNVCVIQHYNSTCFFLLLIVA